MIAPGTCASPARNSALSAAPPLLAWPPDDPAKPRSPQRALIGAVPRTTDSRRRWTGMENSLAPAGTCRWHRLQVTIYPPPSFQRALSVAYCSPVMLRNTPPPPAGGMLQGAVVQRFEAGQHLHQRGFAGAVGAHERGFLPRADQPVGFQEKHTRPKPLAGIFQREHLEPFSQRGGRRLSARGTRGGFRRACRPGRGSRSPRSLRW